MSVSYYRGLAGKLVCLRPGSVSELNYFLCGLVIILNGHIFENVNSFM